ncbi:DUF6895 family protein, partial [Streptomyces calidiresistens]|nr:hypothetical protein [Streptomyces calidiresistens]
MNPSPLEELFAGTLGWLERNLDHFDPFSTAAPTATHPKAKAVLELGLLCHCAQRRGGLPSAPSGAEALFGALWRHPALP